MSYNFVEIDPKINKKNRNKNYQEILKYNMKKSYLFPILHKMGKLRKIGPHLEKNLQSGRRKT